MPSVAIVGTRGYPSYYGGFETAVRKLAPYLADNGWDVTVYGRPGATKPDDATRDNRVRVVETWGIESRSLSTLSFGLSAAMHVRREKPDIAIVMNCANGYWLPIYRLAGIPTLVNVDGIEWDRAKWGRVAKWVFRTGARWTARHANRLIFDSHEIARRWQADFARDGEYIPYGGESVNEVLPVEPPLSERGYVLMVARFVPENTVREFFAAATEISNYSDVVLVGSSGYGGELDDKARELAEGNARIHWLGHVNDDRRLFGLWKNAAVYFHGHSVGGTNPALVQAMALGVPIVARDTVYNREVLGNSAAFANAEPGEIAEAVKTALDDTGLTDARQSQMLQRVKDIYNWDLVNSRYLHLMENEAAVVA